jgi:hypothetical protein
MRGILLTVLDKLRYIRDFVKFLALKRQNDLK